MRAELIEWVFGAQSWLEIISQFDLHPFEIFERMLVSEVDSPHAAIACLILPARNASVSLQAFLKIRATDFSQCFFTYLNRSPFYFPCRGPGFRYL